MQQKLEDWPASPGPSRKSKCHDIAYNCGQWLQIIPLTPRRIKWVSQALETEAVCFQLRFQLLLYLINLLLGQGRDNLNFLSSHKQAGLKQAALILQMSSPLKGNVNSSPFLSSKAHNTFFLFSSSPPNPREWLTSFRFSWGTETRFTTQRRRMGLKI